MQIGLIGAGNMATALARGFGEPVIVADAVPGKAEALAAELGGEAVESNADVALRAGVPGARARGDGGRRVAAGTPARRRRADGGGDDVRHRGRPTRERT